MDCGIAGVSKGATPVRREKQGWAAGTRMSNDTHAHEMSQSLRESAGIPAPTKEGNQSEFLAHSHHRDSPPVQQGVPGAGCRQGQESATVFSNGMTYPRSKLTSIALVIALMSYLPVCCCWTETVAAWMAGDVAQACGHVCCGHHAGAEAAHPQDSSPEQGVPDGERHVPSRMADCMCGVQHRIVPSAAPTVLDFEPALVGFVEADHRAAIADQSVPTLCANVDWNWAADRGVRSLLRLHCALIV